MTESQTKLLQLIKDRALLRRDVKLASGQGSSFYIDGKMILMHAESSWRIGDVLFDMTKDMRLDAIGGPEVGAIPMATATALRYREAGLPMEGFFVRKEAKAHGTQKRIEGMFKPGFRVAIVEDVMTTGGSVMQAIDVVLAEGGRIEVVICIVDRLQGAREAIETKGLRFMPVFTIRELGL